MIQTIAFDGDDTLWHNETLFSMTQEKFRQMLSLRASHEEVDARLYETEQRNLRLFGYGIKGFMLSMIETAIELTEQRIAASDIQRIIDSGKAMLQHPLELLPDVRETLERLHGRFRLMLITKGDLFDQESKIARSGLAGLFDAIEIVSEKEEATYRHIVRRHGLSADSVMMVGNSMRSDILPAQAAGLHVVHVPYHIDWQHEVVAADAVPPGITVIRRLSDLEGHLAAL